MVAPRTARCKHIPEVAARGSHGRGRARTMLARPRRRPAPGGSMSDTQPNIEALLSELRVFEPPPAFTERAIVSDPSIYDRANADHEAFWAEQADRLTWFKRWDTVMRWTPPSVTWFEGGQLNASYNCLDRHVEAGGGDKVAFHWE